MTDEIQHSIRFRLVSTLYPIRVTEAYGGDLAAAADASDDEVAAKVGEWERSQGLETRDWPAIGRAERDEVR